MEVLSILCLTVTVILLCWGLPLQAIAIAIMALVCAVIEVGDTLCRISQAWWAHPLVRNRLKPD